MSESFQVIATKQEKKNYINNKINKLFNLSKNSHNSRNTAEALAILDNLKSIGISKQQEQQVNRILLENSKGMFTFGSRIPSYDYYLKTPRENYYLLNQASQQQLKKPLYITSPSQSKLWGKDITKQSFTKDKVNDYRDASISFPKPKKQESAQELLEKYRERKKERMLRQKQKIKEKEQMKRKLQQQEQFKRKLQQQEQMKRKLQQQEQINETTTRTNQTKSTTTRTNQTKTSTTRTNETKTSTTRTNETKTTTRTNETKNTTANETKSTTTITATKCTTTTKN